MKVTRVYTKLSLKQPTYRSTNTNLKLNHCSRLQSYLDYNIYKIKHVLAFRSKLSIIRPHNDNSFQVLCSYVHT